MFSMSSTTLLGLTIVVGAVILIACSRYREWLLFMLAGMAFWFGLELLRTVIQMMVDMPLLHGYVSAFLVFLGGVAVALAIKDFNETRKKNRPKPECIEHTPVYEDDQHQYLG